MLAQLKRDELATVSETEKERVHVQWVGLEMQLAMASELLACTEQAALLGTDLALVLASVIC